MLKNEPLEQMSDDMFNFIQDLHAKQKAKANEEKEAKKAKKAKKEKKSKKLMIENNKEHLSIEKDIRKLLSNLFVFKISKKILKKLLKEKKTIYYQSVV